MSFKTNQDRRRSVSTVVAGVMPQATYRDHWQKAVREFKNNAQDPDFAEIFVRDAARMELFINKLTERKKSSHAATAISYFLSHRHVFNRLSILNKEAAILPWVESLDTSEQRARVLKSNAWLRNIVRSSGKEKFIPTISSLLDSLSTDDLRATILSETGYVRHVVDSYLPRDKAREWLDKIAPKV
jgi:hypothetical protein